MAKTLKQLLADLDKYKNKLSKTKLEVCVTAADIRKGKPGEHGLCPIALGVKRAIGGKYADVAVALTAVEVGGMEVYKGKKIERFVGAFDKGKKVKPFKFSFPVNGLLDYCD